jgi:hypothetical protein
MWSWYYRAKIALGLVPKETDIPEEDGIHNRHPTYYYEDSKYLRVITPEEDEKRRKKVDKLLKKY